MKNDISLTKYTRFSGCGAKLGPEILDRALCGLSQSRYPEVLVDYQTSDDAGVYQVSEDLALVQTVDFFPPIVDDPYTFGQIAAANALSDIYAMGGRPVTALSIVGFPQKKADISILRKIMEGGLNKLEEAGTALVGGHSIQDEELKFGFAVTGLIHPKKTLYNNRPGKDEVLILTKALGTGTINSALRGGVVSNEAINAAVLSMQTLNKYAAEIISRFPVSACTDVTGFGLLGHCCEMILGTDIGFKIEYNRIRFFPNVLSYIEMGLIPGGTYRNKEFRQKYIHEAEKLPKAVLDILFDPQTSGGLLFSIPREEEQKILSVLRKGGIDPYTIGQTTDRKEVIEIIL